MLWRHRKSALTIPAELHEKLSRSCRPIDQVPSEIVRVRMISGTGMHRTKDLIDAHQDYSAGA